MNEVNYFPPTLMFILYILYLTTAKQNLKASTFVNNKM